jgi:PAS domain S-box-containing protein
MCEMYGYSREEARGLDVEALSQGEPPYTQQDALTWIKKAAEGEPQILEWRARRKSGNLFWAELNMRHARIGDRNRLLVVVRDITERKLAEEALQKAHKELEARVEERTKNLKEKTEKLERMNKLFVDRELRMKELKEDIKKLKRKMREGKTLSAEMDDIGNENC